MQWVYISTSHGLVRAARSAASLFALHTPVASLNFASTIPTKHSLTHSSSYFEARANLGAHSAAGCELAARWLFRPLTRMEKLQGGTIPPGSCHQKKPLGANINLTYCFGKLRCCKKQEFVVYPRRTVILRRTVSHLSATRGTPPRDPGVRDWGIFFYNSVTLARRIYDRRRGFFIISSGDKESNNAECSSILI